MNVQHSTGTPVRWTMSAIGRMSATRVRAAQFARIVSRSSPIVRASRSASAATPGPAPGKPMSAVSMPSPSILRRMSIFSSIEGIRTDGDCRPSLSVSSSSITGRRTVPCSLFQSWMRGWRTRRRHWERHRPMALVAAAGQRHGDESHHEHGGGRERREADTVASRSAHPIVHQEIWCSVAGGNRRGMHVPASGKHQHAVEDHVPDEKCQHAPERDRQAALSSVR